MLDALSRNVDIAMTAPNYISVKQVDISKHDVLNI